MVEDCVFEQASHLMEDLCKYCNIQILKLK
jgi:hypothetical protein